MIVKLALNRRYRIFYSYYLIICIYLAIGEESIDLDIVSLDRLFRSSFDLEYNSIVLLIFADIV